MRVIIINEMIEKGDERHGKMNQTRTISLLAYANVKEVYRFLTLSLGRSAGTLREVAHESTTSACIRALRLFPRQSQRPQRRSQRESGVERASHRFLSPSPCRSQHLITTITKYLPLLTSSSSAFLPTAFGRSFTSDW